MIQLTPEELETEMRNVLGIDGKGVKWKAGRLSELLRECPEEVKKMCDKLKKNIKITKETDNE